jgi:PAS domain S-box-containing protein
VKSMKNNRKITLRESEQRFRKIFDSLCDGIIIEDVNTRKFYLNNKKICQMLGYSTRELRKLGVKDILPEESLPYVIGEFEKLAKGKTTVAKDIPVKRKDGSVFCAEVSSSRVRLGRKNYLVKIFRDISDRKTAVDILRSQIRMLTERSKELQLFYKVSRVLSDFNKTSDNALWEIIRLIPSAYKYPEVCCVRIEFKGKEFKTDNWSRSKWVQSTDIFINKEKIGVIEVTYLEDRVSAYGGAFLKEERDMLEALANLLGVCIFYKGKR